MKETVTIPKSEYNQMKRKAKLADKIIKRTPESAKTYIASEKTLKKDWSYKGDDVWDEL